METVMILAGCAIIAGVIFLLIKQYETRLVLLGAGLLMCIIAGNPMMMFKAFADNMVLTTLVQTILSVMGFAAVMKITKCDAHLITLLVGMLSKVRWIMIPAAVLVTAFINISLPSAAGCAAAVGALLIPLLISLGVHPAIAASAVMAGTFGSMMSPGLSHNSYIAEKLMKTDVMQVIIVHWQADVVCILIAAFGLALVAYLRKEDKGYVADAAHSTPKLENPKIIYALIPIIPVFLLVISAIISSDATPAWGKQLLGSMPWLKSLPVPSAMLIGIILGIVITRSNPSDCVKEFFNGMGSSYAAIMGIIIAAGVFVAGMKAIGLVDGFLEVLKGSDSIARWAAAFGPFLLAIITGSGDAATLAFNAAVSPHAEALGMTIPNMSSLATLAGTLGRTMSPLAGAAIVCAGIAAVSPLEIAKRNAPSMIVAVFVALFMLG